MRHCAGKLQKIILLGCFLWLLVPAMCQAAGRSDAAVKSLLSKYESWIQEDDDDEPNESVRLVCPEFIGSDMEVMYYLEDIISLLKGRLGTDATRLELKFRFLSQNYDNKFGIFYLRQEKLMDKLAYAWPFWCGTNSISPHYSIGTDCTLTIDLALNGANADPEYLETLEQIVAEGKAVAGSDTKALVNYFYDWLQKNVKYDFSYIFGTAEDAILEGVSVCSGFACAFYDLCTVAGIPVLVPTSDSLDHAWNEVYFNGQWYTLDVLFVVSSSANSNYLNYEKFFTDPNAQCDDPAFMAEIKKQLIRYPIPYIESYDPTDLKNQTADVRDYIQGLSEGAVISCTSSDPAVIATNASGQIIPVTNGTAVITIEVRQNGTTYTFEKEFENSDPLPQEGDALETNMTGAVYVVTKAGAAVTFKAPAKKNATVVTIPATVKIDGVTYKVTAIADGAFKNNKKLKTVNIGKNVKTIGASAFRNCTALRKVTISSGVKFIGRSAFYNCKKMTSLVIRSAKLTARTIGGGAFTKTGSSNYRKLTVKVPKKSLKMYQSMLKKKGLSRKAKIRGGK